MDDKYVWNLHNDSIHHALKNTITEGIWALKNSITENCLFPNFGKIIFSKFFCKSTKYLLNGKTVYEMKKHHY